LLCSLFCIVVVHCVYHRILYLAIVLHCIALSYIATLLFTTVHYPNPNLTLTNLDTHIQPRGVRSPIFHPLWTQQNRVPLLHYIRLASSYKIRLLPD
jgi:hypothetical protein